MRYSGLIYIAAQICLDLSGSFSTVMCYCIFMIAEVATLVNVVLLQAIMAVRVYVLLGRSKVVLYLLGTNLLITQVINIVMSLWAVSIGPSIQEKVNFVVVEGCFQTIPPNRIWVFTATDVLVLGSEVIMCAMVLWYTFSNLTPTFWHAPLQAATTLSAVIAQDNLIYFFLVTAFMVFNALMLIPAFSQSKVLTSMELAFQTIEIGVMGPWMILRLRRSYERATGASVSHSCEITTVIFSRSQAANERLTVDEEAPHTFVV